MLCVGLRKVERWLRGARNRLSFGTERKGDGISLDVRITQL